MALGVVVLSTIASAGGSVAQASVRPHIPDAGERWAFATVHVPSSSGYTLASKNAGDDRGTPITVQRSSAGQYQVTFTGEAPPSGQAGVAFATGISNSRSYCEVSSYGVSSTDALANVYCFDSTNTLADTPFTVNYLNLEVQAGNAAYLFLGDGSSTHPALTPAFAFNSTGAANTVTRKGTGVYHVVFPGLGSSGGNVQVGNPICHVHDFGQDGSDEYANVRCLDAAALTDTLFAIAFTDGQGLKPPSSAGVAYLSVAASQTTASLLAERGYQSNGRTPHVNHFRTGRYVVTFPGLTGGGAAQVTSYGSTARRCEIARIASVTNPARIVVTCHAADGSAADTGFGLQYTEH